MDPKSPNRSSRSTPQYGLYQRENFWKSNEGGVPPFSTDPGKLEDLAKEKLTQNGWYYASSNAGQSHTIWISLLVIAVGDKTYIMFDPGVRGASDSFKDLALGAKFVFVRRLWVWGLSIMGETGVRHVMKSLLADFDILLNVGSFRNVSEIDRTALESGPQSYPLLPITSQL